MTVQKLVYGGAALGRLDGRVVLAPFALPGERIRAEAVREKPGWIQARTLAVLDVAPERVAPPCPVFGRCGGCHYQHAPYDYQLRAKRAILAEELRRLGKISPPEEIAIIAGEPWGYRNRAQFHIEGGQIGYREAGSSRLCAIDQCPISSPTINLAIGALREMLPDPSWPDFLRAIEVFTDERLVQLNVLETARPVARRFFDWCAEKIPGMVPGALDYQTGAAQFRVSRHSFFQVNRFLLEPLAEVALEGAQGDSALDVYAGVGFFSLALAERFREVAAVESRASAARDLRFNAQRAGRGNLQVVECPAGAHLNTLDRAPDFVLLDPPRAGLGKAVVRRLSELRPAFITIVACDPATLARDLAGLLVAGYRIEKMTLVDLFPQTYHLETVVRLAQAGVK